MKFKLTCVFFEQSLIDNQFSKNKLLMDSKSEAIYEEFRCELGIHEKDIINAQNLHNDLRKRNPFRYESPFLISAVCVYAILDAIPQNITIEEIEKISHIKKEDILKCYNMILDTEFGSFLSQKDDKLPKD